MGVAGKALGYAHVGLAVVVAVQFLADPILSDDTARSVWNVVNWLMAVGALSALVISYIQWRASVSADGREQTVATVMVVSAVLLALAFFENWFSSSLFASVGEGMQDDAYSAGALINPAFVVVSAVVGLRLLRNVDQG